MKLLAFLTITFVVSGCASNDFLKPHQGKENAKLRLVSIPSNNNFIHASTPNGCPSKTPLYNMATLGAKANLVRSLSRLDIPLYNSKIPASHQNEIFIPAGESFSFQFNGVGITGITPGVTEASSPILYSWCRKIISFTPKANANYEAVYDYVDSFNGKKTCGVKLFEISKGGDGEFVKKEESSYATSDVNCK